jgi:hypothetical protein
MHSSALDGGRKVATLCRMNPRIDLDTLQKEKICFFCPKSNLNSFVVQPVVWSPYRLSYADSVGYKLTGLPSKGSSPYFIHLFKESLYNPVCEETGYGSEEEHYMITGTCISLAAVGSTHTHTQCKLVPPTHRCLKLICDSIYSRNNRLNITTTITYIHIVT